MTIFERMVHQMTKINWIFSTKNWVPNTVFKLFFFQIHPYRLNGIQKTRFEGIFHHINGSVGPILSKNNRIHPWVDSYQPCVLSWVYIYMRMGHAKTKRSFNVGVLLRQSKQHSAVRRTFSKQPNTIRRLLVLQREFTFNTFM